MPSRQSTIPDVPWIKEAMLHRLELRRQVDDISAIIKPYQISSSRRHGWSSKIPPDYGEKLDQLEAEYLEKKALAEAVPDNDQ